MLKQPSSRYLNAVEATYNPCVYHNPMHAADVMHGTNYLVSGRLAEEIPAEELLAVLLRCDHGSCTTTLPPQPAGHVLCQLSLVTKKSKVSDVFQTSVCPRLAGLFLQDFCKICAGQEMIVRGLSN